MREHGVDLAGFRGEVCACHHLAAVVARNLVEQMLELTDIAIHRKLEFAVAAVLLANFIEGLLTLQSIEPAGEDVSFAALVAVPQIGGREFKLTVDRYI